MCCNNNYSLCVLKNIVLICANHGREKVLNLYCAGIKRLREQADITINAVVVGDDNSICKRYDIEHVVANNNPVSEKYNIACQVAKNYNPDYVITMGDDDLINIELLQHMTQHTDSNFIGVRDIYMYNTIAPHRGQMIYILSSVIGCCRAMRSDLLDKVNWKPWVRERDYSLDQIMWSALHKHFVNPYIFIARDSGGICIDVKSSENLNVFVKWNKMPRVDPKPVLTFLSDEEREILTNIIMS